MTPLADAPLLRDFARTGSERAFGELVLRHTNLVYSAAFRQTNHHEIAREITQEVFIDLARKAPALAEKMHDDARLDGWLYTSTRYLALNAIRDERRRVAREQMLMPDVDSTPAPDAWAAVAPVLDEAMAELNDPEREAVVLRFFNNLDYHAVGRALGVSDDTAQKRVTRAVEHLRELLEKKGVTVGGGAFAILLTANSVQAAPIGLSATMIAAAIKAGAANAASSSSTLAWLATAKAKFALAAVVVTLLGLLAAVSLRDNGSSNGSGSRTRLPVGNGVAKVSMGGSHGVILASDGSLWSWGTNYLGWPVLGLGNINQQPALHRLGNENDWMDMASSQTHCLAVKSDGTIWGWGQNLSGQLGAGTMGRSNSQKTVPTPTAPGNDWQRVAAGGSHSLALKKDGTLWAWGNNWAGQLGLGFSDKAVPQVSQVGTNANWIKVWAGSVQSVAMQSDGSLWFWGSLTGSAQDTNRWLVPTRVSADTNWAEVGFGYFMVFATKTDGTLWAWGRDAGLFTGAPVQLVNPVPACVGVENNWRACSSSDGGHQVFQKQDGSLWSYEQGYNAKQNPASGAFARLQAVPLKKDIVAFDAAYGTAMGVALTKDGEVWNWGRVLGQNVPEPLYKQEAARLLGRKPGMEDATPVVRQEPWLLPHEE